MYSEEITDLKSKVDNLTRKNKRLNNIINHYIEDMECININVCFTEHDIKNLKTYGININEILIDKFIQLLKEKNILTIVENKKSDDIIQFNLKTKILKIK